MSEQQDVAANNGSSGSTGTSNQTPMLIVDNSGLQGKGDIYVTGHGIPANGDPGAMPSDLRVLGSSGKFVQAAVAISSASCTGTTVTITTTVANQIAATDTLFVSGVDQADYNGVFTVATVTGNSFTYTVPQNIAAGGSGGAVYLKNTIADYSVTSVQVNAGLATLKMSVDVNIPQNSPVYVTGFTGSQSSMNGVWEVYETATNVTTLDTRQVILKMPNAADMASTCVTAAMQVVSITPILLSDLPTSGNKPQVIFDDYIKSYSAQFAMLVAKQGKIVDSLGVVPKSTNLINFSGAPFANQQPVNTSISDVVEFAYAASASGLSTFDLTQVDGVALPLTLESSKTHNNEAPKKIGINDALTDFSRDAIAIAFSKFIKNETAQPIVDGQFARLRYDAAVNKNSWPLLDADKTGTAINSVALAPQTTDGAIALATATAAVDLVPGQTISVSGATAEDHYNGTFTVLNTILTDTSLSASQFTYQANAGLSGTATATVTPSVSGAIAVSSATVMATLKSGTPPATGESVSLSGIANKSFDGTYTVLSKSSATGLSEQKLYLSSNHGSPLVAGNSSNGGAAVQPLLQAPPALPDNEFYVIAAPKDWLANLKSAAVNDPMVTFWDSTVNAFFASGNYLQVAVGANSYIGKYNDSAAQFDFYSGLTIPVSPATPSFHIAKPSGAASQSLSNALWVWAQSSIPGGDRGLVWDQIVQAFCRGVAMDGVFTSKPTTAGQSNVQWIKTSHWYDAGHCPHYCPYSKFVHYATLDGQVDRTGVNSIYSGNRAYGFSEDETPFNARGTGISTGVPSKMDGTIPVDATLTLTLHKWNGSPKSKTVINQSGNDLTVSIVPRIGETPGNSAGAVSFAIAHGSQHTFTYGNAENPYLDGITATWQSQGHKEIRTSKVENRGSALDDTFNTNNTLTISSCDPLTLSGSNT